MSTRIVPALPATPASLPAGFRAGPVNLLLLVAVLAGALALGGCAGGDESTGDVLARVGDREILGSYYEDRLMVQEQQELPRGADGQLLDMAGMEGKEKFLQTLINKEVMALTAVNMGFAEDPLIVGARRTLTANAAGQAMWANEVPAPTAEDITAEQVETVYEGMGRSRLCRYIITDFVEDARKAREMALSGADWFDVVDAYHDGDPDPEGKYEINVPYGRYKKSYDEGVFGPAVGGVSEPIETAYGYWVMQIVEETTNEKPALEDMRSKIADGIRGRVMAQMRQDFTDEAKQRYAAFIDEGALWKVYSGLPANESLFYPGTQDPMKKEDLQPLEIAMADFAEKLYGYTMPDGTEHVVTVGEYKVRYDDMSVFQRPKRAQMLGGLRLKLNEEIEKTLLEFEAERLGYHEHPDVVAEVGAKMEELLVNHLYNQAVQWDKTVQTAAVDSFWALHRDEYSMPETRDGRLVICPDQEMAADATEAARAGMAWRDVLVNFGSDKDNKTRAGKLEAVRTDATGAGRDAMFALAPGETSDPFAIGDGRWAVVQVEKINPPHQMELADARENVEQRILQIREETAFKALLGEWTDNLEIEIFPEALAGMKSWDALQNQPPADAAAADSH